MYLTDTDKAREYLIANLLPKFADTTFEDYVKTVLAGDFAYHLARYLAALPLPVMPEQAEPVAKRELIDLYKSVNNMMLAIGTHEVVESHNKCVKDVMNALYALDDGYAIIRANDLVEKAFMPFNQAFPKAVQEYIDKLEGGLNTFDLLARIAQLEAENQKLKEDAAWIPIDQCLIGKPAIVKVNGIVQHIIVMLNNEGDWDCLDDGPYLDDFHPSHFKYLPEDDKA